MLEKENRPRKIVSLYRAFFRASNIHKTTRWGPSARKAIQPLSLAFDFLCKSSIRDRESLIMGISGSVNDLMRRIRLNMALGYFVLPLEEEEHQAIIEFATYVVDEIFYGAFGGDIGRLAGTQRGLLEDTCDFMYRLEDDAEKLQKRKKPEIPQQQTEN